MTTPPPTRSAVLLLPPFLSRLQAFSLSPSSWLSSLLLLRRPSSSLPHDDNEKGDDDDKEKNAPAFGPAGDGQHRHHHCRGARGLDDDADANDKKKRGKRRGALSASPSCCLSLLALSALLLLLLLYLFARRQGGADDDDGKYYSSSYFPLRSYRVGSGVVPPTPLPPSSLRLSPPPSYSSSHVRSHAKNVIIVACHSTLSFTSSYPLPSLSSSTSLSDEAWHLAPYQRHTGIPALIRSHIIAGIKAADKDPEAVLLFSGGETNNDAGPIAESTSYYAYADASDLWTAASSENDDIDKIDKKKKKKDGAEENKSSSSSSSSSSPSSEEKDNDKPSSSVRRRASTETYALDSYTNVLYSLCRFSELTGGRYPKRVTVVSFEFKRRRFEELHARALRLGGETEFVFIGIDPPPSSSSSKQKHGPGVGDSAPVFDLAHALEGEEKNAYRPFESDLYGCRSSVLLAKKEERNPFSRTNSYRETCPELAQLFDWCGGEDGEHVFEGTLPWD